jgi:hypothetical protein
VRSNCRLAEADLIIEVHQKAEQLFGYRPRELRCYRLPAGRMPVVRELAARLAPFARVTDSAAILSALRDFERE